MELTNENYYSEDANNLYMSVSQFKDFAGTSAHIACEETGLKKFLNQIPLVKTTPLLVGSYVDAYFEGTLDQFKEENPEIFKTTGDKGLKADYRDAEFIIRRIENDPMFKAFMSGEKQKIMTGNLFGIDWKIKMDSYHPDDKIVDLKVMKDMAPIYSEIKGKRVDFIHYWGYDIQGAVYQKIVEINTGKKLPFYLAVATKEKNVCDIEIIEITQPHLDKALEFVEDNLPHVLDIKNGIVAPKRCGICSICKGSKVITAPITIDSLMTSNYYNDDETEEPIRESYSLF